MRRGGGGIRETPELEEEGGQSAHLLTGESDRIPLAPLSPQRLHQ